MNQGFSRPSGDIVTLLDLTPRDYQDGEYTPLGAEKTWWLPEQGRRLRPHTLSIQQFPFRGPAAFGQRFTFDIGSVNCGDLLLSSVIQIDLGHWFDDSIILGLQGGTTTYQQGTQQWYYANSLGSVILQRAELEVGDQTLEIVDGDFLNAASLLFQDMNNQYGFAVDGLGRVPLPSLTTARQSSPFPTQNGTVFVPLPFFFQRVKLQEAFPLLACREGTVRIHVTLRPFSECVRLLGGRSNCDEVPLGKEFGMFNSIIQSPVTIKSSVAVPQFKKIQLITYGAHTDGVIRQRILRSPFEILVRTCQTFTFDEPLKYATNKTSKDVVQVQLPLEVNHPMEEIIWFVRRKGTENEWTNYSAVMSSEYDASYNLFRPLLHSAAIQFNGIELISAEEQWFRQHISLAHKGGAAAYSSYIYGYSFAKNPGEHQPSGTANASRLQTVRLTLDVRPPGGDGNQEWEIKVFVITLEWVRFQDGIVNKMFSD
jgi:hypothetical protein